MHVFDADTSLAQTAPFHFTGRITPNWSINETPNGGYLMALLTRSMQKVSEKQSTPILTANFLSPCFPGEGVSLDGIRDILSEQRGDKPLPPPPRPKPGHISVCSKLVIADGIELLIDPEHATLSPEDIRKLTRAILSCYATIQSESPSCTEKPPPD